MWEIPKKEMLKNFFFLILIILYKLIKVEKYKIKKWYKNKKNNLVNKNKVTKLSYKLLIII